LIIAQSIAYISITDSFSQRHFTVSQCRETVKHNMKHET